MIDSTSSASSTIYILTILASSAMKLVPLLRAADCWASGVLKSSEANIVVSIGLLPPVDS